MKTLLKQILIINFFPILISVGILGYAKYRHQIPEPEAIVAEQVKILIGQNAKIVEAYGQIYDQKERLEAENLQLKEEVDRLKSQLESLKTQLDR